MRIPSVLIAWALALAPAPATSQDKAEPATATVPAAAPIAPAEAKALYDQMCAGCHGYRGDGGEGHRGGFSPHIGTLAQKEYMTNVTDEYIDMIIRKGGAFMGKIATMPAWEKRLDDAQIAGLVRHIRTFVCVKDCDASASK